MKLKSRKASTYSDINGICDSYDFVTFISSFALTENKQAMFHQNKMQAYYIAEVELRLLKQLYWVWIGWLKN